MDYSCCIGSDLRGVKLKSFIYDYPNHNDEEPTNLVLV